MKPYKRLLICFAISFLFSCVSQQDSVNIDQLENLPDNMESQSIDPSKIASLYRIISFDGGGIKGALTAKLLTMIQAELPQSLDYIDLYAGTSTGSIIALALADKKNPQDILDLYLRNGKAIFTEYPAAIGLERGLNTPLYTNKNLKTLLIDQFTAEKQLADLKHNVIICSFNLDLQDDWSPVYLSNFPGTLYEHELVVDTAIRSSSAPVYFPSYQGYIDGGVVANNPSLLALSAALDPQLANQSLKKIRLLSISTGNTKTALKNKKEDWGAVEWLNPFGNPKTPLISIFMDGVQEIDDYQCRMILGDQYFRLNIELDFDYPMDDWKNIDKLIQAAEDYPETNPQEWSDLLQWIKNEFLE